MVRCAGVEFFNPMPRFAAGERELSIRAYGSGEHGLGEESGSASTLEEIQFDCEAA